MASTCDVRGGARATTRRQWGRVAVLWTVTFATVTSQTLLIGLLTPVAGGLGADPGTIGYAVTITSLVSAAVAPLVPRILGARDRRHAIAVALLMLCAGNAATAAAQGFPALAAGRLVLGVAVAVVWALAGAVATRLVAPGDGPLAVSVAVSGVAAAAVAGVPLGTLAGDLFGWRTGFALLAAVTLLLAGAVLAALPPLPGSGDPPPAPGPRSRGGSRVGVGLVVVTLLVAGHFAACTYVRPILERDAGFGPSAIAAALLGYGAVGLAGNFAGGALAARWARRTVAGIAAGILASIVLLAAAGSVAAIAGASILLWGLTYGGMSVSGQIWLSRAAPDRVEQVTGRYVGTFNASVALGSLAGGTVLAAGTTTLLWSAAGLVALALLILPWSPNPPSAPPQDTSHD